MKMTNAILSLFTLAVASHAHADGALDPAYGDDFGLMTIPFNYGGAFTDQAFGSVLQPDRKLIVVGSAISITGDRDFAITRLMPDGLLDSTFGFNGKTSVFFDLPTGAKNDVAHGVALEADGKIVVVGTADGTLYPGGSGASSLALVQLLPNGTPDANFGNNGNGKVILSPPYTLTGAAVAIHNGAIVVVGFSGTLNPPSAYFVQFGATGATVANGTFTPSHWASSTATAISFDNSGRILVSGYYSNSDVNNPPVTQGYDCFVTRILPDTFQHDPSFIGNDLGSFVFGYDLSANYNDYCWGHTIQPDGKIVVVGQSDDVPLGASHATVARIKADGSGLDASFAFSGSLDTYFENDLQVNSARAVKLQSDGKIVVAGYGHVFDPTRAPYDFGVMRLTRSGALDTSFVGTTAGSQPGKVMIGFEDEYRTATGEDDGAFALSIDKADRIYAVGQAQHSGADYDMAVARLQSDKIFVDGFQATPP